MRKEYFFSQMPEYTFTLGENFATSEEDDSDRYLVSNSNPIHAEVYAPEINFYIRSSADNIETKTENIKLLYEVRSIAYDLAQNTERKAEIGRKVLLFSTKDQTTLREELAKHDFTTATIAPQHIKDVTGSLGRWQVTVLTGNGSELLETDQILWEDGPDSFTRRRGIYDFKMLGIVDTVALLLENCGTISYTNFIKYNASFCQYHHRREVICGHCAHNCPSGAITLHDTDKELKITDIDCVGCGKCAGICPTGAIEYTPVSRTAFQNISALYKGKTPLVLTEGVAIENLRVDLQENVVPLIVEQTDFLDECHLLSLLQKSGFPILIYTDTLSPITENGVSVLNEIFQQKYHRQAIYVCANEVELAETADQLSPFAEVLYDLDERSLGKREIFAKRLSHLIGGDDLGSVQTGPYLCYGSISINEEQCTLCLSCADACNTGALTVHAEDRTLRCNPALCTACGYCETTCPEKNCLHLEKNQIVLRPDFFKQNVMAKDELFKCVECGKGFAPAKAVGKIAAMMQPLFGDDQIRIKALYCCPACKARVMLESLQTENILK